MSQHFFDLHLHPAMKTLFKSPDKQRSAWYTIKVADGAFGHALGSQASLGQIAQVSGMNLICVPVYAPETPMMQQSLLRLGALIYGKEMDLNRIKSLGDNSVDYPQIHKEERKQLLRKPDAGDGDFANKKVKLLRQWSDYNPNDLDTIHILFSVEGGHNFYGAGNDEVDTDAMLQRFQDLIDEGFLVLYLTLAHLAPNVFLNHAYGMKIFPRGKFLPLDDGIALKPLPIAVATAKKTNAYDFFNLAHKHGVVLDIKHMSLRSRRQFLEHLKTNFHDRPAFASHVGFTGFAKADIPKYCSDVTRINDPKYSCYKLVLDRKKGYLPNTWFNPNSINLFDEEILQILRTGGLVGLSMDARIMGIKAGKKQTEDYEFISFAELDEFGLKLGDVKRTIGIADSTGNHEGVSVLDQDEMEEQEAELEEQMAPNPTRFVALHLHYYINHILHLCKLSKEANFSDVFHQTCIGSDFDGLISPLDCCRNVTEVPNFANALAHELPLAAAQANIELPLPVDELIDRLFYRNAFEFLAKYYTKLGK